MAALSCSILVPAAARLNLASVPGGCVFINGFSPTISTARASAAKFLSFGICNPFYVMSGKALTAFLSVASSMWV